MARGLFKLVPAWPPGGSWDSAMMKPSSCSTSVSSIASTRKLAFVWPGAKVTVLESSLKSPAETGLPKKVLLGISQPTTCVRDRSPARSMVTSNGLAAHSASVRLVIG